VDLLILMLDINCIINFHAVNLQLDIATETESSRFKSGDLGIHCTAPSCHFTTPEKSCLASGELVVYNVIGHRLHDPFCFSSKFIMLWH